MHIYMMNIHIHMRCTYVHTYIQTNQVVLKNFVRLLKVQLLEYFSPILVCILGSADFSFFLVSHIATYNICLSFKSELDKWKEKFKDLETRSNQRINTEPMDDIDVLNKKFRKLQDELQVSSSPFSLLLPPSSFLYWSIVFLVREFSILYFITSFVGKIIHGD